MSKELKVYRCKFKGVTGEGLVGGANEDAVKRLCKRYTAKLISVKFSHTETFKKQKGNK